MQKIRRLICGALVLLGACANKSTGPDSILKIPENIYPADQAITVELRVALRWQCQGAERYAVRMDTTSALSAALPEGCAADTMFVTGLFCGTKYYWQVIAYTGTGDSVISPIWSFTTKQLYPLSLSGLEVSFLRADVSVCWNWSRGENSWDGIFTSRGVDTVRNYYIFGTNPAGWNDAKMEYVPADTNEFFLK